MGGFNFFRAGNAKQEKRLAQKENMSKQDASADQQVDVVQVLRRMTLEEPDTCGSGPEKRQESESISEQQAQMVRQMGILIMPDLFYALSHPEPAVRRKSCWALQILGSSSGLPNHAITEISKLVLDTDERVRRQAVHSLGALASNVKITAAVPDLLIALKCEDKEVRIKAAAVLGKIGLEAASALASLRLMMDDPDIDVSQAAQKAFLLLDGSVKDATAEFSVEIVQLARQTASSEDAVKKKAWAELEKLPNREAAIAPLMEVFRENGGKAVGLNLPLFFGAVGTEACRAPLLEVLEYARRSSDDWERQYLTNSACHGLLKLNEGVPMLRSTLSSEWFRFVLMRGLMSAGDAEQSAVVETLTTDERGEILADIISFFRSVEEKGKYSWEVSRALQALGTDAIEALLEVFRNVKPSDIKPDGLARHEGEDGAPASAMVSVPGGIEKLRALCSAEEYEKILIRAHNYGNGSNPAVNRALGEIATPMAIGCLVNALWNGLWRNQYGEGIRKQAADALVKVGKKAHEPLLKALKIRVPTKREYQTRYRKEILAVLSETGDEACVPAITAVLSSDPLVTKDAQAALEAIGKRCGATVIPGVDLPRALPVKKITETGDPYVDDCFRIDFEEFYEEREWFDIPEAKAVTEAGNAGMIDEALCLTADFTQKYPDFYFGYYWFAVLYKKQKRYDDAHKCLMEGLRLAKSKESLCAKMGSLEWELHDLHGAVLWWIKSIAVQLGSQYATDEDAFLCLSYVAEAIGMGAVCVKLRSWADRLRSGQIRLNTQAANEIYVEVNRQATPAVRFAIELLDRHYLSNREE